MPTKETAKSIRARREAAKKALWDSDGIEDNVEGMGSGYAEMYGKYDPENTMSDSEVNRRSENVRQVDRNRRALKGVDDSKYSRGGGVAQRGMRSTRII